jgi:hypothetical protein
VPTTEIPEGGSLFDIEASEEPAQAAPAEPTAHQQESAEEAEDDAPEADPTDEQQDPEAKQEEERPAQKQSASSGAAHQPKTDVDIDESGSLFDL